MISLALFGLGLWGLAFGADAVDVAHDAASRWRRAQRERSWR